LTSWAATPPAAGFSPVPEAPNRPLVVGRYGSWMRRESASSAGIRQLERLVLPGLGAGLRWSDRALARSGMDYAGKVEVRRHVDWDAFLAASSGRIVLATTSGAVPLTDARFAADDILLLGSEGAGVPAEVHDRADLRVRVPMRGGLRSLNVAVAGAILLGEALRQTDGWPAT